MKVMIRKMPSGNYSAYVPKKIWRSRSLHTRKRPLRWACDAGQRMELQLPEMAADTRMPITVEARRLQKRSKDAGNYDPKRFAQHLQPGP